MVIEKQYRDLLELAIYGRHPNIVDVFASSMHAQYEHSISKERPLQRMASQPTKRAASGYDSEAAFKDAIERTLIDRSDEIARWLASGHDLEQAFTLSAEDLTKEDLANPTGRGFLRKGRRLQEIGTCQSTIVLFKTSQRHDGEIPPGCYAIGTRLALGMKTIYPELCAESARLTKRDVRKLLESSRFFRDALPSAQARCLQNAGLPLHEGAADKVLSAAEGLSAKQNANPSHEPGK